MKTEKQAEGHHVPAQTETPTAVTNKVAELSNSSNNNRLKFGEQIPELMPICYVDPDSNVKFHCYKQYGDWKPSPFIFALEEIQTNISSGEYRCINDCLGCGWFEELPIEDQLQLIDIALWYLHDAQMGREDSNQV